MMEKIAVLITGLLVIAESQASDGEYKKFLNPSLNSVKLGNGPDALGNSHFDSPKLADREESQAVQKLLANNSNSAISLAAISIGVLSLVAMLTGPSTPCKLDS